MGVLVANRVEVLPDTQNRRHFLTVRATITNSVICQSEDPYKFRGKAWCRLCNKAPESVAHTSHHRHDSALKVLFMRCCRIWAT